MKRISNRVRGAILAIGLLGAAIVWSSVGPVPASQADPAQEIEVQQFGFAAPRSIAELFPPGH